MVIWSKEALVERASCLSVFLFSLLSAHHHGLSDSYELLNSNPVITMLNKASDHFRSSSRTLTVPLSTSHRFCIHVVIPLLSYFNCRIGIATQHIAIRSQVWIIYSSHGSEQKLYGSPDSAWPMSGGSPGMLDVRPFRLMPSYRRPQVHEQSGFA